MANDNKLLKAYLLGYTTALEELQKELHQAGATLPRDLVDKINKRYSNKASMLISKKINK